MSSAPFDLRDHDHVELVADLGDERRQVVEPPRRVEAVDPGPQLGVAEVDVVGAIFTRPARAASLSSAGTRVLEVAEQHVDGARPCRGPWRPSSRSGVEEVDHPGRPDRDLAQRRGRADGERPEEVLGAAHGHEGRSCRDGVGSGRSRPCIGAPSPFSATSRPGFRTSRRREVVATEVGRLVVSSYEGKCQPARRRCRVPRLLCRSRGFASRSAVVHKAVRLLPAHPNSAPPTRMLGPHGRPAMTAPSGTRPRATASPDATRRHPPR